MLSSNEILELEGIINYGFKNKLLLIESLSHPSLKRRDCNYNFHYERLEFLGDTVLSLIIAEILIKEFPKHSEGALAKIKACLVSKDVIYTIAKTLQLDRFLIMTIGEESGGGRKNINNIESAMEALIAAIYLDSNLLNTKSLVHKWWHPYICNEDLYLNFDPKSKLQEWSQAHNLLTPKYHAMKVSGKSHSPIFEVQVSLNGIEPQTATSGKIKDAEKKAAKKMLEFISTLEKFR